MDLASILGLLLVAVSVACAAAAGGGNLAAFLDGPSLACVGGGCIAALLLCYPLRTVLGLGGALKTAFFHRPPGVEHVADLLADLAETARREGLLALDARLSELRDPFLILGVQLAVDGTRPEMIEEVMRAEIELLARRRQVNKGLLDQLGKYAPAFGMIGTLLGLVMMLGNMADPSAIGPGMAVALLTTLYGALLANGFFLPLAEKLNYLNREEASQREMIVRGILAI